MTWADYIRQKLALRDHSDSTDLHTRAGQRVGMRTARESYEMSGTWRGDSYLEGGFYLPPDSVNPKVAGVEPFGGGFFISIGTENDDGWRPLQDADTEQDERYGPLDTSADGLFPLCDPRVVSASPTKATPMVDPAAGPFMLQPAGRKMPHDHPVLVMAGTEERAQHLLGVGAWAGLLVCDQRGDEAPSLSTAFTDVDGKKVAQDRMAPIAASFRTVHSLDNECQGALELGQPFGGRGWGFGAMCGRGPGNGRSIGLSGSGAGGILHVGTLTDKHRHAFNKEGEAVTVVELNLDAPWHFSDEFCAAPQFAGPWQPAGSVGTWTETQLRYDPDRAHSIPTWDSATKTMVPRPYPGQMRWETRVPFAVDQPEDGSLPPGDGSLPPGGGNPPPIPPPGDGVDEDGVPFHPGGVPLSPDDEGPEVGKPEREIPLGDDDGPEVGKPEREIPLSLISGFSVNYWLPLGMTEILGVPYSLRDGHLTAGSPSLSDALEATSRRPSVFAGGFLGAWTAGGWGFTAQPGETGRKGGTADGLFFVHSPELTIGHFFRTGEPASSPSSFEDIAPSLSHTGFGLMPDYAGVWFGMPTVGGRTNGFKLFQSGASLVLDDLDADGEMANRITFPGGVTGTVALTNDGRGRAIYGDGSDGDLTVSSGTTVVTYDKCYGAVVVENGGTLELANGYTTIRAQSITINSGGVLNIRPLGFGPASGTTTNGDAGADADPSPMTGGGGAGGDTASYTGGAGGSTVAPTTHLTPRDVIGAVLAYGQGFRGGASGGGGAGDGSNAGGAGGQGGGLGVILAQSFVNNGTVQALGSDGGDATGGDAGGGGGGQGGLAIIVSDTPTADRGSGTYDASGGSGGAGSGTGEPGANGADGEFVHLEN